MRLHRGGGAGYRSDLRRSPPPHRDLSTDGRHPTDAAGAVASAVELTPFGDDTGSFSNNRWVQRRMYTSYERDANLSDEAHHRRYNRFHSRFDQPDPYGGSYDLADPQSLNRYSYTQNDPVSFNDPSGLNRVAPGATCYLVASGTHYDYPDGRRVTAYNSIELRCFGGDGGRGVGESVGGGRRGPGIIDEDGGQTGGPPQKGDNDCAYLAAYADYLARTTNSTAEFVTKLSERFKVPEPRDPKRYHEFSARGFKGGPEGFVEDPATGSSPNQVNHYVGILFHAYRLSFVSYATGQPPAIAYAGALSGANARERGPGDGPDRRMNNHSAAHGVNLRYGLISPGNLGNLIRNSLCQ